MTTLARKFLKQQIGQGVWIAYGTADVEIEGYVLAVNKFAAEIQRKDSGEIVAVPLWAISEMVEA
jgi:hypothetical protein